MLRREAEELQRQMEQMAKNNSHRAALSPEFPAEQFVLGFRRDNRVLGTIRRGGKPGRRDPRVQQSLDRLRQATDDMRRATSPQQSEAEARRAADRLKEATDLLGGMRQQQASSKVDALARRSQPPGKGSNSDQSDRIRQMFGQGGGFDRPNSQDKRKLADDRQELADDLGQLGKETAGHGARTRHR